MGLDEKIITTSNRIKQDQEQDLKESVNEILYLAYKYFTLFSEEHWWAKYQSTVSSLESLCA